jgi:hypothetical protein
MGGLEPTQPGGAAPRVRPRPLAAAVLAFACLVFVTLEARGMRGMSVTYDEYGHLPAGLNLLNTGDFRYCELNPPLMNALSALPLRLAGVRTTFPADLSASLRHDFWANGFAFMGQHRRDYHELFLRARGVTVGLMVVLGLVAFAWARQAVPANADEAGLLAAVLVWFSPEILAHGQLVTTDAGVAAFMVFALLALDHFLRRPTWPRSVSAGMLLGLAQLVKFTAVYLFPIQLVLVGAAVWREERLRTRRFLAQAVLIFVLAVVVVNVGYGFGGSFRPLASRAWKSRPIQAAAGSSLGRLPVPLPTEFLAAFDKQLENAQRDDLSFLFGRSYSGGRWYYFPALLAIKTPLPVLALGALAACLALRGRGVPGRVSLLLLLPATVVLTAFSFFSDKQIGLRMILPSVVLMLIWIAVTLAAAAGGRPLRAAVGVLLAWLALDVARVHPHYLAYFNPLAGGPDGGYRLAVDSNLDWGQDLPALNDFMQAQKVDRVQLLYFGRVDPELYGIRYHVPLSGLEPGYLAISRTLYGRGSYLFDHGYLTWHDRISLPPGLEHVATLGHTIDVFRVPG